MNTSRPDIVPGWQERAQQLRRTIRECQHDGKKLVNADGIVFCSVCGLHLEEKQ